MPTERAKRKTLPVYDTRSEVHRMIEATENDRDAMLIEFLFQTGARISEALNARAGDLTKSGVRLRNAKQGTWVAQPDGTKKHVPVEAEKHVLLHPEFLVRLREYTSGLSQVDHIFARYSDGKPISRVWAWHIVTKAAAEAGVLKRRYGTENLRPAWPHTLRHSCAVHLIDNQAPVTLVQEQLGHSSLASTQIYSRLADPRKEAIIAGIEF